MSWQSSITALTARYGNVAQKVTCLVAKTLVPGIVVDLVESAFDVAKTVAKDQQEAALLAKTRANVQDLERLGELLGHLTGDMAKVCAKAEAFIEEDMPEKVQGAVLRALKDDPALMAAQRKMELVCRQMSRIEEQNSKLIEGVEEMLHLVGRIGGVADYVEDMKQAGVNGRFFVEMMQVVQTIKQLLTRGQTDQIMAKLRELPLKVQAMPSVITLEAGARFLARESVAAATLLQQASRLKPNDTELKDLSRAATEISGLDKDTKPESTSLIPLKRFNISDVIDGFKLTARLGSGGWGQVFRATRDGQTKALKIMHPELSQNRGVLDRFKAEISTLIRLPVHSNLVRIEGFGYCITQNCWYLVMDYIDGPTLDGYLKTNGAMSAGLVKSVFQPVAEALGAAHSIGIVHLDIKPGNIMFRNADNKLVLIDFGLAIDSNYSGKAQVDGKTVSFAAPEQLRCRPADARSDVFSLAATMHFALEYADRDRREPESFSATKAPVELRDAMVRSMVSNPAERFAHAGELASAMKAPLVRAKNRTIDLGGGVGLELVLIPAGTFMMGSAESEAERSDDENRHEVTISKPFYLGKYPITLAQWQRFVTATSYKSEAETSGGAYFWNGSEWNMDPNKNWKNPGFKQEANHPVVCISWNDVQQFHGWLNSLGFKDASKFGSPSEAQWEYACRAGTTTPYHFGNQLNGTQANCNGNFPYGTDKTGPYLEKTTPVGKYPANAWGLHDMHGNVLEWCADWYGDYPNGSIRDPEGASNGERRVLRGGSWVDFANDCRAAFRYWIDPTDRFDYCGGRVFLSLDF